MTNNGYNSIPPASNGIKDVDLESARTPLRKSITNAARRVLSPHRNVEDHLLNEDLSVDQLEITATDADIDATINSTVSTNVNASQTIIRHYRPHKLWLWTRLHGTVLQHGSKVALGYMIFTAVVCYLIPLVDDPKNPNDFVDNSLLAFNAAFKYVLTLTTFILTFFLNQSYNLWRQIYNLSRAVQGRTNDFGMLAATHAERDADGKYTPRARRALEDIGDAVRLFHAMAYASKTRRYRVLHTHRALRRMVERGILGQHMLDALLDLDIPPNDRVYAVLEWIIIRFRTAMADGAFKGGQGFEEKFLEKALMLRGQFGSFGDVLDARIPLAYGHFVQIMVDTLLFVAPFALYKEQQYFAVFTVGILAIFFAGLLDLSKVMLDPFDLEDYCDGVIDMNVAVFIRESNSGSTRFINGGEVLPKGWLRS